MVIWELESILMKENNIGIHLIKEHIKSFLEPVNAI